MILFIRGGASKTNRKLKVRPEADLSSLMEILRSNNIPIASSCYGEGVCKKCIIKVNDDEILSCQTNLSSPIMEDENTISIDYL